MDEKASADDRQLLRRFTENNSQGAFEALTARYLNLVYSVCRRELADDETAEDVTQAVFLILARKAPSLGRNVVLSGWLFQTARFAAKNARLQAQRRAAYEQKAAEAMGEQSQGREEAAWSEIEPLLNQSLAALRDGDRECVLLRFFQGLSFAEAGAALGLPEEAARKRVTRALEKMRAFFGKEGVIVPGVALAALLSAHAAKAAPLTCQASVAHMTVGAVAGHLNLGLTGSHAYQLSEGILKAMKIAQVKAAVGVTTGLALGLGAYAIAGGRPPALMTAHPIRQMGSAKLGHVLAQAPGRTMTPAQIAARCRLAYKALRSYQGTTTSVVNGVTEGMAEDYHTSANILFVRPGKIHAEGTDMGGFPFAYVSDGTATAEQVNAHKGVWKTLPNAEMAVASVTGIAQNAATTVPALLLGTNWGDPFTSAFDPEVREDDVNQHPCYVVTDSLVMSRGVQTGAFWIDEKTFLLRRYVSEAEREAQTFYIAGKAHAIPAGKSHIDERFTNERLNGDIPEGTFTVPAQ